nr:alpha/beta hydrolase [Hoeflea prorocentri]
MRGERDGPKIAGSDQGLFERIAEQWSHCGIASLRFSTRGKGGSDGNHQDMSLEGRIRETRSAIRWVSRQPDLDSSATVILGYSQGAAIAATVAGRLAATNDIGALLLWSPNLNPLARYEKTIGMEKLTTGLNAPEGKVVMIAPGLGFKQAFFRDVWSLNPAGEISPFRGPIHLVYGVGDQRTGPDDAEPFLHFHDGLQDMTTIDGNHHLTASAGIDATDELAWQQADWLFNTLEIEGPDCPPADAGDD